MRDMFEYVQRYLSYNWQPIPVHYAVDGVCSCGRRTCASPGKHPIPQGWQKTGFPEEELKKYWAECKWYNIGLVTGSRTNILAVDVDKQHNGYESLQELEDQYGVLPHTTTSVTGGDGRHFLYQYPTGIFVPNKGNLMAGLDIRGEGGQIVAPPSYHNTSKKRYQWLAGASPDNLMPVPAPAWLIELIQEQEAVWLSIKQGESEAAQIYYSGARNNNLFRMGCRLRVIKDLTDNELGGMIHALNQSKCRPPLDDGEVNLIIGSVLGKGSSHTVIGATNGGKAPKELRTMTQSHIFSLDEIDAPIPYVIPNLLSEGEICLLASPTEAGKSLIAMSLALSVAAGLPAWGRGEPCKPGRVMYCTEELAGRTIKKRFRKLAKGLGIQPGQLTDENFLVLPQQNLSLSVRNQDNIDALIIKAKEFNPTLVVLDTFISYYGAGEKDSESNRAWFGAVPIALRNLCNCSVIIQHHTRKLTKGEDGRAVYYSSMSDDELNSEIRGTSDLAGVSERVWFIWKRHEEQDDFGPVVTISFRNSKAREGDKAAPFFLVVSDPEEDETRIQTQMARKNKKATEMESLLREVIHIGEEKTKAELAAALEARGKKKTQTYVWLTRFVDQSILMYDDKKNTYSLNKGMVLITGI